ncbi:hypothetical protein J5O08_14735, partial [Cellulomonas sp. PS-H5]|nr:hypothetical protein [Cellulomonas sp. PS-H5]
GDAASAGTGTTALPTTGSAAPGTAAPAAPAKQDRSNAGPARTAPAASVATAPAAPASAAPAPQTSAEDDDEAPVPQWQSLLRAMAPAPLPEDEAEITDATGDMLRGVHADEEIDEIDEQPERLRKPLPYTWLQWIILAVVAFVLGFLIIFVANTATNGEGPDVPAAAATALDAAPAP